MNLTSLIAIYGAVISSILFVYRYLERKELKRNLSIDITSGVKRNENNEIINGKRGEHVLIVTITNRAKTSTYIDRYFFKSYNMRIVPTPYCGFKFRNGIFDDNKTFPFKLEHGEKVSITYPLSDYTTEGGQHNMDLIRKMAISCKYL